MPRFSVRRKVAVLLLGALLAAPWALRSEPQNRPRLRARQLPAIEGLLGHFWQFLSGIWIKNGASPDPNGGTSQTTSSSSSDNSDAGASADPNG